MGDVNQQLFLSKRLPPAKRVCEVGAQDFGSKPSFRALYPDAEFAGVDLEPGPGVDYIVDLNQGIGGLSTNYYDLVICCSVLEHTPTPWLMAENLQNLIAPGGSIYIAAPWVWRYHRYPEDYFRFSFAAIKSLFRRCEFKPMWYSSYICAEFFPARNGADDALSVFVGERKYLPYLEIHALGVRPNSG